MPFLILQHHDGTFYWHHQWAFLSAIILRISIPAVVCPAGAGVVGHTPISVDIGRPPGIDPVIVNNWRAVIICRCCIVDRRSVIIGWIICIGVSRRIIPVVVICSGIIVPAVIVSSWGQPIIFMMIVWSVMAVMILLPVVLLSIVILRIIVILLAIVLLWAIRSIVGRRTSFWISIINCRAICHQH